MTSFTKLPNVSPLRLNVSELKYLKAFTAHPEYWQERSCEDMNQAATYYQALMREYQQKAQLILMGSFLGFNLLILDMRLVMEDEALRKSLGLFVAWVLLAIVIRTALRVSACKSTVNAFDFAYGMPPSIEDMPTAKQTHYYASIKAKGRRPRNMDIAVMLEMAPNLKRSNTHN